MPRIHFTAEDFARLRMDRGPDPHLLRARGTLAAIIDGLLAGLIASRRSTNTVLHTLTPLGAAVRAQYHNPPPPNQRRPSSSGHPRPSDGGHGGARSAPSVPRISRTPPEYRLPPLRPFIPFAKWTRGWSTSPRCPRSGNPPGRPLACIGPRSRAAPARRVLVIVPRASEDRSPPASHDVRPSYLLLRGAEKSFSPRCRPAASGSGTPQGKPQGKPPKLSESGLLPRYVRNYCPP